MSFIELLQEVKTDNAGGLCTYQEVSFEKVVEAVVKERASGGQPIIPGHAGADQYSGGA